jgi:magnesium transporter
VEKTDSRSSSCIDLGGFSWTNIDSLNAASMDSLAAVYPFHPLDLEDCLSKVQLPKIDEYQDYLFIILHFPRYLKAVLSPVAGLCSEQGFLSGA